MSNHDTEGAPTELVPPHTHTDYHTNIIHSGEFNISDMNDGSFANHYQSGVLKTYYKIGGSVFVNKWTDYLGEDSLTGDGTGGLPEFDINKCNWVAHGYNLDGDSLTISDANQRVRVVIGKQTSIGAYGIQINDANSSSIFKLWGNEADLCGWTLSPSIIQKVTGNNKIEMNAASEFFQVTHESNKRVRMGKLTTDDYGLEVYGSNGTDIVFTADGTNDAKIGGFAIGTDTLTTSLAGIGKTGQNQAFWAGHDTQNSAPFRVTHAGDLVATSATITGAITATSGTFSGAVNASSGNFTGFVTAGTAKFGANVSGAFNGIWLNANNYWYDSGDIKAQDGTIGGWTLSSAALTGGSGSTTIALTPGTSIHMGAELIVDAPFSVTNAGVLKAESGTIGGWDITSTLLRSATADWRIELNKSKNRMSIFDNFNEKVVMGYLEGLLKNNSTGLAITNVTTHTANHCTITVGGIDSEDHESAFPAPHKLAGLGYWEANSLGVVEDAGQVEITVTSNTYNTITVLGIGASALISGGTDYFRLQFASDDYGFWALDGDSLFIDGDMEYDSGDWMIQSDGALKFVDGNGIEFMRLGTHSGSKGLFIGAGISDSTISAKYTKTGFRIGDVNGADNYIDYTGGTLTIKGDIDVLPTDNVLMHGLCLVKNVHSNDGSEQLGEIAIVAITLDAALISTGEPNYGTSGTFDWLGTTYTIPYDEQDSTGNTVTLHTGLASKKGFIIYETVGGDPFTVNSVATNLCFGYMSGGQWVYDNNSAEVAFIPTDSMVAIGHITTTSHGDRVASASLFEPRRLVEDVVYSDVNVANVQYTHFDGIITAPPTAYTAAIVVTLDSRSSTPNGFGQSLKLTQNVATDDGYGYLGASNIDYNVNILPNESWIYSCYVSTDASGVSKQVQLYVKTSAAGDHSGGITGTTSATAGNIKRIWGTVDLTSDASTSCILRIDWDSNVENSVLYCSGFMLEKQRGSVTTPSPFTMPSNYQLREQVTINNSGMRIKDSTGTVLADYGTSITLGDDGAASGTGYITIDSTAIKMFDEQNPHGELVKIDTGVLTLGNTSDAYMTLSSDNLSMYDEGAAKLVELNTGVLTLGNTDDAYMTLSGASLSMYDEDATRLVSLMDGVLYLGAGDAARQVIGPVNTYWYAPDGTTRIKIGNDDLASVRLYDSDGVKRVSANTSGLFLYGDASTDARIQLNNSSIKMWDDLNHEVFKADGGVLTIGYHETTKIVLDGEAGTFTMGSLSADAGGNISVADGAYSLSGGGTITGAQIQTSSSANAERVVIKTDGEIEVWTDPSTGLPVKRVHIGRGIYATHDGIKVDAYDGNGAIVVEHPGSGGVSFMQHSMVGCVQLAGTPTTPAGRFVAHTGANANPLSDIGAGALDGMAICLDIEADSGTLSEDFGIVCYGQAVFEATGHSTNVEDSPYIFYINNDADNYDIMAIKHRMQNPDSSTKYISFHDDVEPIGIIGTASAANNGDYMGGIRGDNSGGVYYATSFTGGHTTVCYDDNLEEGMIVESSGDMWYNPSGDGTSQTALPKVRVTDTNDSSKVFGTLLIIDAEIMMYNRVECPEGYLKVETNSLGEGNIWITNINGDINNGDYISSSEVGGHGRKQGDDILHNYTVGKCTEDIDWDNISETITHDGVEYKKYLAACTYHCG